MCRENNECGDAGNLPLELLLSRHLLSALGGRGASGI